MDEKAWLASDDVYELITRPQTRDDRKRRLLSCAIGRTVFRLVADPKPLEAAIEFCERWADGEFDRDQWIHIRKNLKKLAKQLELEYEKDAVDAIIDVTEKKFMDFKMVHESARFALAEEGRFKVNYDENNDPFDEIVDEGEREHLLMVRDLYGNPFKAIEIDSGVLAWKSGSVQQIADEIYESGSYNSLGVLGDALTEAGCKHEDVISHCYDEGHIRGCWVVDLLRSS